MKTDISQRVKVEEQENRIKQPLELPDYVDATG